MDLVLLMSNVFVSAVISGLIGWNFTLRSFERSREIEASDQIRDCLYELESLVLQAVPGEVESHEFATSVQHWHRVWRAHRQNVSSGWRHLRRSVDAAVGEFAGPVMLASFDRAAARAPLAEFDGTWQQHAELYLSYAGEVVGRLAKTSRPGRLMTFDEWLAHEGRWPAHQ